MTATYTSVFLSTLDGFGSYGEDGDWGKRGPEFLPRRRAAVAERTDAARADWMRTEDSGGSDRRSTHRADQCADQMLCWCPRQDSNLRHTV